MPEQKSYPIFEVFGLSKEFNGKQVLSIPHLAFNRGKIYCLYGSNGSGKTTLFEILTLLQKPEEGRIFFKGKEVYPRGEGFSELRSKVTLIHQNPLLFDTTVEKNVDYGLRIRKVNREERRLRVDECLKIVGLEGFQRRKSRELSGGEAQRVAIARALCIDPEVLFLDEFSANIDNENRIIAEKIIKTINRRFGTTIVFTTHYMDQAYRLSDNVIHLFQGKVATSQIRNIFRGVIKRTEEGNVFENDKLSLFVTSPVQGEAVIAIPLTTITVSMDSLDSSMRNCLNGKITHITDDGNSVILRVMSGEFFEVVITKESFRKMGLEPGTEVYLNFKASSVEVL
jgi:tungstate transport system ATP-binding protein